MAGEYEELLREMQAFLASEYKNDQSSIKERFESIAASLSVLQQEERSEQLKNTLIQEVIRKISPQDVDDQLDNLLSQQNEIKKQLAGIENNAQSISDLAQGFKKITTNDVQKSNASISEKEIEKRLLFNLIQQPLAFKGSSTTSSVGEIESEIAYIKSRQLIQLLSIRKKTIRNLYMGILFSMISFGVFITTFLNDENSQGISKVITEELRGKKITTTNPKFTLLIRQDVKMIIFASFMSTLSLFFLRLYRQGQSELQYCENERTNLESRILATRIAIHCHQESLPHVIQQFLSVERNRAEDIKQRNNLWKIN